MASRYSALPLMIMRGLLISWFTLRTICSMASRRLTFSSEFCLCSSCTDMRLNTSASSPISLRAFTETWWPRDPLPISTAPSLSTFMGSRIFHLRITAT